MNLCRGRWSGHRRGRRGRAVCRVTSAAQASPILPSTRVFLAGPVSLYPQIALRDAGTDSNVFNDPTNPRSDLTYALTPRLYAVVPDRQHAVRGHRHRRPRVLPDLHGSAIADDDVRWPLRGHQPGFRPFASVGFVTRGDREGYEIDARARHTQTIVIGGRRCRRHPAHGADRVGQPLVDVVRTRTSSICRVLLADQLNHQTESVAAGARFRVDAADDDADRRRTSTAIGSTRRRCRDADSLRVGADRGARHRRSDHRRRAGGLSDRSCRAMPRSARAIEGSIGSARLHYALPDVVTRSTSMPIATWPTPTIPSSRTTWSRVAASPSRSGCSGRSRSSASASGGRFATSASAGTSFDGRREVTTSLGGGFGIQIQSQMRFALTYEHTERTSTEPMGRNYERTRVLGSIIYGL